MAVGINEPWENGLPLASIISDALYFERIASLVPVSSIFPSLIAMASAVEKQYQQYISIHGERSYLPLAGNYRMLKRVMTVRVVINILIFEMHTQLLFIKFSKGTMYDDLKGGIFDPFFLWAPALHLLFIFKRIFTLMQFDSIVNAKLSKKPDRPLMKKNVPGQRAVTGVSSSIRQGISSSLWRTATCSTIGIPLHSRDKKRQSSLIGKRPYMILKKWNSWKKG